MSNISFQAPTKAALDYISENLRLADFEEYVMATGRHPYGLFAKRALAATVCLVAYRDGVPAAVLGYTDCGDHRAPWMMGTDQIEGHAVARFLLEFGRPLVRSRAQEGKPLRHRVYAENEVHIKFIKMLGFEVDETSHHYGPLAAQFKEFRYV